VVEYNRREFSMASAMPVATTLRVLVDAPPDAGRAADWALFDGTDRVIRKGRDRPAAWPTAERREAVIAAAHGRLAVITVPVLPPARASAAARYALEDQLAGVPETAHVALAAQAADGSVRSAIVSDEWMRAFAAASTRCGLSWERALLESDLAPAAPGVWRWCAASATQDGFARTDRGATLAVGPASADTPPSELVLALTGAGERKPRSVRVDAAGASAGLLANARKQTGIEFVAGTPWRWAEAPPAAFAAAINVLSGAYGATPRAETPELAKLLRPAVRVAGVALAIAVFASAGQWLWLRWQVASTERAIDALARSAVPEYAAGREPGLTASVAIARRERDLRHRAGLAARDDFVPLLAAAAPALGSLPPGTVRALSYADGHVVVQLQKLDEAQISRMQRALRDAGLVAIAAPTASGPRLRIGLD
jgi:type II secretion system protein L